MRKLTTMIVALALPAALAACEGPRQVDATPPTVTYSYQSQDDFDEIERRADRHCGENYGLRAFLVDRVRFSDGYEATFACE